MLIVYLKRSGLRWFDGVAVVGLIGLLSSCSSDACPKRPGCYLCVGRLSQASWLLSLRRTLVPSVLAVVFDVGRLSQASWLLSLRRTLVPSVLAVPTTR